MTTPPRPKQPYRPPSETQPGNRLGRTAVIVSLTFVILGFIWRLTTAGWLLAVVGGILGLILGIVSYGRFRRGRVANPKPALISIAVAVIALILGVVVFPLFARTNKGIVPTSVSISKEIPRPASSKIAVVPPGPPLDPETAKFVENCAKGVSEWRAGQVDYPRRLTLNQGESASYVAAVDIRNRPLPPVQVIPGEGPHSEPVAVQCALGARLVPVGGSLEVEDTYWVVREFTPTGVVNWSWSVKALAPEAHDLRLELQPTLIEVHGRFALPTDESLTQVSSFVTGVQVNTSLTQRFDQWWRDNWNMITTVAVALAATALSLVKFGGDVGTAMQEAAHKWRTKVRKA